MNRFYPLAVISAALILPASVFADVSSLSENFNELPEAFATTSAGAFTAIGGTNVDIVGPTDGFGFLCAGPESGNCVDLGGSGGNANGIISSQQFALGTYLLSFDLIGNGRGDVADSTTVTLGSYTQTFKLNSSDVSSGIVVNQLVTVSTEPSYLMFSETPGPGGDANIGNVLDNVSVTPEPGFYGILALGLTGVLAAVRRRKSAQI
jgi:hypothetical protein